MNKICILGSQKDPAGLNIQSTLLKKYPFIKTEQSFSDLPIYRLDNGNDSQLEVTLAMSQSELLNLSDLDQNLPADLYIFISRHTSESNRPGLLLHPPGNWGENTTLGGEPYAIGVASPIIISQLLHALDDAQKNHHLDEYPVTMEVTHHGPTQNDAPIIFIEIGSTETQWSNPEPANTLAEAVYSVVTNSTGNTSKIIPVLGIGGTHYCPRFNKLVRNTQYATGHIISKHHVDQLTLPLLKLAIERTVPPPQAIVLDWKGLNSKQRAIIADLVEQLPVSSRLPILRVNKLIKENA